MPPTRKPAALLYSTLLAALLSFGAIPARGEGIERLVVVFKTHFDIGYTAMASEVVAMYRTTMIDTALEVCERNRTRPPSGSSCGRSPAGQ